MDTIVLPVHGQGTICYKPINLESELSFSICNKDRSNFITFKHGEKITLHIYYSFEEKTIVQEFNHSLLADKNAIYWLSIDSQHQVYMGGIGEARLETKKFKFSDKTSGLFELPDTELSAIKVIDERESKVKKAMESYVAIRDCQNVNFVSIINDPVVSEVPLLVKNTNDLTMDDISKNTYLPHSFLNSTCQQLYDCVSGKKFVLNTPDFPDFAKAIEYSIATPGCWCNRKLIEKSTEFNPNVPNIEETYLRITLGKNSGESPGIPYVMEIWPCGHYSPVHSHAGASAIIRVLHGSINVKLYPFLSSDNHDINEFAEASFNKNDVTWITPDLNQTHQLKNKRSDKTCITIQCYMYDQNNKKHYDYFDYKDVEGKIAQYEPDSDMEYSLFKKLMKKEWENRPRNCIFKFFTPLDI